MKNQLEFSYYELTLLAFLKESHPDKVTDIPFIKARAAEATEAYCEAFDNGYAVPLAAEMAGETLFRGLHFSKHDTIVTVLWNEFADVVPQGSAAEVAIRLNSLCETIFAQYTLTDDFVYSTEYNALYTELTGTIQLYLDDNGEL